MRGSITIKGETDLFTLAIIEPTEFQEGLSVGDIKNLTIQINWGCDYLMDSN
jgi:hypothetical protein